MRLLLGVFFLLACTGAPSDGYHRGTLVRPPPAPHRPGVGAPVVGQPGQHPDYPRSPHKRVLPPERGPGLWSGDAPRAAAGPPSLMDIVLPVLPEHEDLPVVKKCVGAYAKVIVDFEEIGKVLFRYGRTDRTCLFTILFAECLREHMAKDPKDASLRGAFQHAEGHIATACPDGLYNEVKDIADDMENLRHNPSATPPPRKGYIH